MYYLLIGKLLAQQMDEQVTGIGHDLVSVVKKLRFIESCVPTYYRHHVLIEFSHSLV